MLQRPVILLVEDEPLIRMTVADALDSAGFEVIEAADARAAQEMLHHRDDIQVLFTDIQMPGPMDGLELASLVRKHWPHINLVIASGLLRPNGRDLPDGTVFLTKPYEEEAPVRTMLTLLGE